MPLSLLQPLRDIPLAVIDTETTGAAAGLGHRVMEIGIARIEGGRVVAMYEQLIDPTRRLDPAVIAITGITPDMLVGQPRFDDQLPRMMELLEGAVVVGHNVGFDISFLSAEFRRAGMEMELALGGRPVLDTLRIARRIFGRGGNSLPILARRLGVIPERSHRALADAVTTAGVLEKLLEPAGGWALPLCDVLLKQGGQVRIAKGSGPPPLPLELEEALGEDRMVRMEYLDARSARTERLIRPLHIRRYNRELILTAWCALRQDRRTFKVNRIVRMTRVEPDEQHEQAAIHSPGEQVDPDAGADRESENSLGFI